jgi:hypothetical protein
MKKDYQKPMLISEEFIPNEYVAACYTLKHYFIVIMEKTIQTIMENHALQPM